MEEIPSQHALAKSVSDAVQMMFGFPLVFGGNGPGSLPTVANGCTVTVPLVGDPMYIVTVQASILGGEALAGAMFACSKKLTNTSMIEDSLRELADSFAGQVKSLMAREHQIGVASRLTDDAILNGAKYLVGASLQIGDVKSGIDIAIAEFAPPVIAAQTIDHGHSVAVADDDDVTRGFLKAALQSAGLRVIAEADNGRQALADFQRLRPDVICLDIDMPEMDGIEVLARVRKESPKAIVFLISAVATAQNVRDAIRLRADGIIVKPFDKARIMAEIQRALDKRNHASATSSPLLLRRSAV